MPSSTLSTRLAILAGAACCIPATLPALAAVDPDIEPDPPEPDAWLEPDCCGYLVP